ncbi:nicolin-1 [Ictalurus furcatus]|uniref:nicolin-1 n=1 Tax=Ictalurus furcatus TaxID=66913 RepID=UPI002350C2BF|nr:nicolin-1 [Ictalurus furcatus]
MLSNYLQRKGAYYRSSTMRGDSVDCVVKSPVALQLGDVVSDSVRPGVYITDVVLSTPVSIQEISFKNYYTAYLTVRVLKNEEGSDESPAQWFTCMRNYRLMSSPHTEGGSQDYFSIYRQQMLTEPDNVINVRLILRQPSSVWLNFNIEDIKIFSLADEESEGDVPSWLSAITPAEEPLDLNGLPDPDSVSSSIQHMWALTEIMQSSQTSASIGRFDVDGCYDVNLLSYT